MNKPFNLYQLKTESRHTSQINSLWDIYIYVCVHVSLTGFHHTGFNKLTYINSICTNSQFSI